MTCQEGAGTTGTERGAAPAAARGPDGVSRKGAPALDGLRVLVVDDDARVRATMGEMLAHCGAEVTTVDSVTEALQVMPDLRPDLLLSDLSMPHHDGWALIRAVRALAPDRGGRMPAVAVSGNTDEHTWQRARAAGFDDYLEKPLDLHRLATVVEEMAMKGMRPPAGTRWPLSSA